MADDDSPQNQISQIAARLDYLEYALREQIARLYVIEQQLGIAPLPTKPAPPEPPPPPRPVVIETLPPIEPEPPVEPTPPFSPPSIESSVATASEPPMQTPSLP